MKSHVVPINHISVPRNVRELAVPRPSSETKDKTGATCDNVTIQKSKISAAMPSVSNDALPQTESNKSLASEGNLNENINNDDITITAGENQIQKDLSDFVTVTSQTFEEKMVHMIEKLSKKVDNLKQVTPPMGPRNTGTSETVSGLLMDKFNENMKEPHLKMKEWKKVGNIVELVNAIDCLELYPLSSKDQEEFEDGSGAILRCETCFFLNKDKAVKLTPVRAAKKLAADCSSICTGKYLSPDRIESLMKGEGNYWRKLKSSIFQHMICANDGQTNFKALSAVNEERNLKQKTL